MEGTESKRFQILPGDIFGNTGSPEPVEYKYNVIATGKEVNHPKVWVVYLQHLN